MITREEVGKSLAREIRAALFDRFQIEGEGHSWIITDDGVELLDYSYDDTPPDWTPVVIETQHGRVHHWRSAPDWSYGKLPRESPEKLSESSCAIHP